MIKVASVCLLVLGVTCAGLAEESQSSGNSPGNAAQAGGVSGATLEAPLVVAFQQKDEPSKNNEHVRARAYLSVDKLPAGSSCQVIVVVNVEQSWHIIARQPKPSVVIPVKIRWKSKNNVELIDVKYPPGKPFDFDGTAAAVFAYEGEVQIRGTVQIPKDAGGLTEEIEMTVDYQACNEFGCLPRKNITLIGKLPIARHGDLVTPINGKLFNTKIGPSR